MVKKVAGMYMNEQAAGIDSERRLEVWVPKLLQLEAGWDLLERDCTNEMYLASLTSLGATLGRGVSALCCSTGMRVVLSRVWYKICLLMLMSSFPACVTDC